ncbi:hypothetical protein CROQUDRAFT_88778 [Cronartium quercuum f. sp. fusiforme G11]|uniref:Uncharacterized protein n=1 Tax=Cronartium quercuum f. sp. fusiforme G11 TaxID=708437 RepID=A0A9P6TET0_9BASI|nr:hypothetical protein CROQUDRAFT_88778 [Cronartium quercuum f. sp. fusiforme G11]
MAWLWIPPQDTAIVLPNVVRIRTRLNRINVPSTQVGVARGRKREHRSEVVGAVDRSVFTHHSLLSTHEQIVDHPAHPRSGHHEPIVPYRIASWSAANQEILTITWLFKNPNPDQQDTSHRLSSIPSTFTDQGYIMKATIERKERIFKRQQRLRSRSQERVKTNDS